MSGSPIAVKRLDHVVLRVTDPARMLVFYRDVLGCVLERERPELDMIQIRAGDSLIDLVSIDGRLGRPGGRAAGAEGRNMEHFCLSLEEFDEKAIRAHMERHNVPCGELMQCYGAEGVGPAVYITDPEGNKIELKGPATE